MLSLVHEPLGLLLLVLLLFLLRAGLVRITLFIRVYTRDVHDRNITLVGHGGIKIHHGTVRGGRGLHWCVGMLLALLEGTRVIDELFLELVIEVYVALLFFVSDIVTPDSRCDFGNVLEEDVRNVAFNVRNHPVAGIVHEEKVRGLGFPVLMNIIEIS